MSRVSKPLVSIVLVCFISASIGTTRTLAVPPSPPVAAVHPAAVPTFVTSLTLPESDDTKYPDLAAFGNTVHMAGNPGALAAYWTKLDSATSSSPREVLGNADTCEKKPDYAPAAVTTGADGAVYVAWISQCIGIFMRKKPSGGAWGPVQTVLNNGTFRAYIDIGVTSDGAIFVSWNQDARFQYTRSTNGGGSWSPPAEVSDREALNRPNIATGPSGSIFIAYGSKGHIYASIWQGSGFVTTDVTPSASGFNADPTGTIGTDGRLYVAWRTVGDGIYYAQRQLDGTWPASRLADGEVFGPVQINADAQNNLHAFWTGNLSGAWDMWYAFQPASGAWQGPISAAGNATVLANVSGAGTVSDKAYGHAVAERFTGSGMATRYFLFSAIGGQPPTAQPTIENGTAYTNKNPVSVSFSGAAGNPTEMRWRWNAVPTDQANDSGGWVAFAATRSIPTPSVGANVCQTLTLYTQFRNTTFTNPTLTTQDSIDFDNGIQASIAGLNPHMAGLPTAYTGAMPNDLITQGGASDGAPLYTRDHVFFVNITSVNECAGFKSFSVPGSFGTTLLPAAGYRATIAMPGTFSAGAKPIGIVVTDNLDNTKTFSTTLIYDPPDTNPDPFNNDTNGLPVLAAGASLTTVGNTKSVIRNLSFSNISVTDNYYGQQGENLPAGRQFWGVWVANSRQNLSPNDPSLRWFPVPVAGPQAAFTLTWSLFTGLNYGPVNDKSGTYYVYARALDGAGNPSARTITTTVTLDSGYALPFQALPLLTR